MSVSWVGKLQIDDAVIRKIAKADVVLDVGVGIHPQSFIRPRTHICVEPHLPYIERLRTDIGDDPVYVFLNCTWDVAMNLLPAESVDTVFALDFIEHLTKADGLTFLKEAERVARRQVVIFTPLGFFPQSYEDPSKPDRWGLDGAAWQGHHSGWEPRDFGEDWDVVCCKSFIEVDQHERPLERPAGVMWAFRNSTAPRIKPKRRLRSLKDRLPGWARAELRSIRSAVKAMIRK